MTFNALEVAMTAATKAYEAIKKGGDSLKKTESTVIDLLTKGDLAAGKTIMDFLKTIKEIGVAYSEEGGKVILNKNGKKSVIFDDIDGTFNYKFGMGMLPYGTIVGVFDGTDPVFNDCIASCWLDFPSGNMFFAERGKGTFVIYNKDKNRKPVKLHTNGRKQFKDCSIKNCSMIADTYMLGDLTPEFISLNKNINLRIPGCMAFYLVSVAAGMENLMVTGDNSYNIKKRKTGEEIGPGYLIIKEAGGVIVDWKGRDIGHQKIGMAEGRCWMVQEACSTGK